MEPPIRDDNDHSVDGSPENPRAIQCCFAINGIATHVSLCFVSENTSHSSTQVLGEMIAD